jgi:3-dehydroquinate synthase
MTSRPPTTPRSPDHAHAPPPGIGLIADAAALSLTSGSDTAFSVPFVHRLRYTADVFGADQGVLAELLEPSGPSPARVQFWLDASLAASNPDLPARIEAFARSQPSRFQPTGPVEVVPGGETIKNDWRHVERILAAFNAADLDRRSYVVAIGGGAVLDAVGFAAAIAHRGIRLIRLPTTTLAQADSGVGVKNAVNFFGKKNWLGAFAVPWAVINDTALLATLPDRDFVCGFAEAVKVSLLKSPAVFAEIGRLACRIRQRDLAAAMPIIRASVELHLKHITQGGDPFETREARPLDFGHWSAHRLEALTEFSLRHGEAVAIGLAIDTVYSTLTLGLAQASAQRILGCLRELGLPTTHPALAQAEPLLTGLEEFRQHLGGRLTLTLLRAIGEPVDVHTVDLAAMRQAIAAVHQGS